MKEKKELRKEVLERRASLTKQQRQMGSLLMTDRLLGHQWFYRSEEMLVFLSFGSEIDTTDLIMEGLRLGKKVYAPKVEGEELYFYKITSMEDLMPGYKGIREPEGNTESYVYSPERAERTLMVMPGVAFDSFRNRLGYGKGFYDRYLAEKEALQLRTIGIGFQCQMVDRIPADEGDIKPYQVICV